MLKADADPNAQTPEHNSVWTAFLEPTQEMEMEADEQGHIYSVIRELMAHGADLTRGLQNRHWRS